MIKSKVFVFIILILTIIKLPVFAQSNAERADISIKLDDEGAQEIISLLSAKKVSPAQLNHAAGTYGNKLLIQKVNSSVGGDESVFKQTLQEIIETGTVKGPDPYAWKKVKATLPESRKLISHIKSNQEAFLAEVKTNIQQYTPLDLPAKLHGCLLLGGGSAGFVVGSDGAFSIALQHFEGDYEAVKTTIIHELYHAVQQSGQAQRKHKPATEKPDYQTKASYYLLQNLWAEGTAEKVGDFSLIKSTGPYVKKEEEKRQKNNARLLTNFRLMDVLLYKLYNDTGARYSPMYDIAFSTVYEEAGYSVGYEMARQLEKYRGKDFIAASLTKDPLEFTTEYILLYHEFPKEVPYHFDTATEGIIDRLKVWKDRI